MKKNSIYFIFFSLMLLLSMNYSYYFMVNPVFEYGGMTIDINEGKVVLSFIFSIVIAVFLSTIKNSIALFSLSILFIFVYIPILSFWGMTDNNNKLIYMVFLSLFFIFLSFSFFGKNKIKGVSVLKHRVFLLKLFYFLLIVLVCFELLKGNMIRSFSLGVEDVYSRRELLHGGVLSTVGGYLLAWLSKIVNPIFFALYFLKNKYYTAFLFLFFQGFIFGLTGHKEQLFYPFLALYIAWATYNKKSLHISFSLIVLIVTFIMPVFYYFDIGGLLPPSFVSRTFFSVALNHYEYVDFFESNDFTYWSNSILGSFIEYKYSDPIPVIIGEGRWNTEARTFANTGYLASGYMHFGYIGVVVYSIIVGFIINVFTNLSKNNNRPIAFSLVGLSIFQLVNGDLFSALLTHGIFVSMTILYLLKKKLIKKKLRCLAAETEFNKTGLDDKKR